MGSGNPSKYATEENSKFSKGQASLHERFLNFKEDKDRLLRLRILDDISINFDKLTIIMFFSPPEFPIDEIAEFTSQKVNLPVVKISPPPPVGSNKSAQMQAYEISVMGEVENRLLQADCQNGCILLNFPQSPKQYSFLSQLNSTAEHIPIFFDIDSQVRHFLPLFLSLSHTHTLMTLPQTMRSLQNKFDRWIHSDSNRSYHAVSNPPLSNARKEIPTSSNMLDDHTGDALVHLESDSIDLYKVKFHEYKTLEHIMMGRLHNLYYTIPSYSTRTELCR